ncbi:dodecin family protein [Nitrogeniibacter aestuarii]|uniref:dodecin family protein n=1 Tax=Nitrogeniibacter aestuarii TaxID=2815343 RepID=UPI001D0FFD23|nr:dodecin family protein [Nitrogeniibacter aestuarii]
MISTQVTEFTAESSTSFDEAIRFGMAQARANLSNIHGAWVRQQRKVVCGGLPAYRVSLKVAFGAP